MSGPLSTSEIGSRTFEEFEYDPNRTKHKHGAIRGIVEPQMANLYCTQDSEKKIRNQGATPTVNYEPSKRNHSVALKTGPNLKISPPSEQENQNISPLIESSYGHHSFSSEALNPLRMPGPQVEARSREKPLVATVIGVEGGDMELHGFKVHFPRNAVKKDIKFELCVDNNQIHYPKDKGIPIAPILEVKPSMKFDKQVTVRIVTWYSAAKGKRQIADILTKEEIEDDWKEDQKMDLSDKNEVCFKVWHFCKYLATVSKESSVDGIYYFTNRLYIQRGTGSMVSAFQKDGLGTNGSHCQLLESDYHPLLHSWKIFGKLGSVFELCLTCTKPLSVKYDATPDPAHFKISSALLHQNIESITFTDQNFPEDYRGTLILKYRIISSPNSDCQIPPRALSCRWPIEALGRKAGNAVIVNQEIQDNSASAVNMLSGKAKMELSENDTKKTVIKR